MKNLLLMSLLLFAGCSVTHSPVTEYRIAPQVKSEVFSSSACKDSSLKVAQVFSPNSLMSQKMKYAQGEFQEFSFSESEWADSPNRAITKELLKSIRETELFSSVTSFKSRSRSDMILETSVEDFMQYFESENEKSYVNIVMSMTLINSKNSKTVATKTFQKRVEVTPLNAEGGVSALNSAFGEVLQEHLLWLKESCR